MATDSKGIIQETKNFLSIFAFITKSTFNFQHFEKKDEPHSLYLSKITDYQIGAFENV